MNGEKALGEGFIPIVTSPGEAPRSVEGVAVNGAVGLNAGWVIKNSKDYLRGAHFGAVAEHAIDYVGACFLHGGAVG